jgi:hypothetical protein
MYKVIGADGKEYEPVNAEQLRQWIAEGRANAQTRVLPEGETIWKTLGELSEFAAELSAPSLAGPPLGQPSVRQVSPRARGSRENYRPSP